MVGDMSEKKGDKTLYSKNELIEFLNKTVSRQEVLRKFADDWIKEKYINTGRITHHTREILEEYLNAYYKYEVIKIKGTTHYKIHEIKNPFELDYIKEHTPPKRRTTDSFKLEVKEIVGEEYIVLGEYKTNNDHIKLKHNSCGHIYETRPRIFLSGSRCPECKKSVVGNKLSKSNTQDHEYFVKKLEELHGKNEFKILTEYKGTGRKIKVRHNCELCDHHSFEILANNLYKYGCVSNKHSKHLDERTGFFSYRKRNVKSIKVNEFKKGSDSLHEAFLNKLEKIGCEGYEVLSEYKNARTLLKVKCLTCEGIESKSPSQLYNRKHCTKCSIKKRNKEKIVPLETVMKRIEDHYGEGVYTPISEYEDTTKHMSFRHENCGYQWEIIPQNLMRGYGCPNCYTATVSKGQGILKEIFNEYNINYKEEVKFDDLKVKQNLRYDFGIYNEKNELKLLIEYNGQQHYKNIELFNEKASLKKRREYDLLKINYAKKKKVRLGIIPYQIKLKKDLIELLKINKVI